MSPDSLVNFLTTLALGLGLHGFAGWMAGHIAIVLLAAALGGLVADSAAGALQNRSAFSLRVLFGFVRSKLATKECLAVLGLLQAYAIAVQTNGYTSPAASAALYAFALAAFGVSVAWWADARLKALSMLTSAEARLLTAPQH